MDKNSKTSHAGTVSVLFVCAGNTCRSVMAEALTRRRFGDAVRATSAGLRPQRPEDAKNAIETLKAEFNLDASGHIPRNVRDVDLESFDCVVAMDKTVAKDLKAITKRTIIMWQIEDPWGDDLYEYKQCALRIMQQVSRLPFGSQSGA